MSKSSGQEFNKMIDQLFDLEEAPPPPPSKPKEEKEERKTRNKKAGKDNS